MVNNLIIDHKIEHTIINKMTQHTGLLDCKFCDCTRNKQDYYFACLLVNLLNYIFKKKSVPRLYTQVTQLECSPSSIFHHTLLAHLFPQDPILSPMQTS
jgi:hypothetical protein